MPNFWFLVLVFGFGEQIEDAAKREFKEETNLEFYEDKLFQVFTYSYPHQDPRRPAMTDSEINQYLLIDGNKCNIGVIYH